MNYKHMQDKRKVEELEGAQIIEGTFDGQVMNSDDGSLYPVPANYASKSKLVEGDRLKLVIASDGGFIFKQIGPVERRSFIGTFHIDEEDIPFVSDDANDKGYRVLVASATYFKLTEGDRIVAIVPRYGEAFFATVENKLVRK